PEFDDAAWPTAHVLFKAELLENRRDPASPYGLMPRMVPMLEEGAPQNFADAFLAGGAAVSAPWKALLGRGTALTLAPNETVSLVLDASILTTAFPHLVVSGGAGSEVRLRYAEALRLRWD